jgi:hypothetical protein
MTKYLCALTGQTTPKAYILRTTEGEELVSPEALLHPEADRGMGDLLLDMAVRISRLEDALAARATDVQADNVPAPAEDKPAATATKKTPGPRKAPF